MYNLPDYNMEPLQVGGKGEPEDVCLGCPDCGLESCWVTRSGRQYRNIKIFPETTDCPTWQSLME